MGRTFECFTCNRDTTLACSRCREVYYCTRHCQRLHWPQHRGECILAITAEMPSGDRHRFSLRASAPLRDLMRCVAAYEGRSPWTKAWQRYHIILDETTLTDTEEELVTAGIKNNATVHLSVTPAEGIDSADESYPSCDPLMIFF